MVDESIMAMPAVELAQRIRNREVSPVDAVDAALARIERYNPAHRAYLTVCADEARAAAIAAEQAVTAGGELGPLHGVPISIKDLLYTKDLRSTGGSRVYEDFVPDFDTPLVARIRAAGAIILGKTNTPEFGVIPTTENRLGEPCANPWDTTRTSGGSSGGAATSAALGLGSLHVGTDGGGSIRIPSSLCGVFGIKPTVGRVPAYTKRWGGYGGWPSLSQAGPISRSVDDAGLLLDVMAGPAEGDPFAIPASSESFRPADIVKLSLRVAWTPDMGFAAVDPEVRELCEAAVGVFEELGCSVEEACPPISGAELVKAFGPIAAGADAATHESLLDEHPGELTEYVTTFLEGGRKVLASDYVRAEQRRVGVWEKFNAFLLQYDLLLTPTLATAAFPIGEPSSLIDGKEVRPTSWTPFTMVCNLTGQPAASVPCGFTSEGLPVGLHVIARAFREKTILTAAQAFAKARPWADRWPQGAEPGASG